MNIKLVGILFAVGSLLACGDSGSDSGGGPSGGSPPAGGGDTGGAPPTGGSPVVGGGGGGEPALTCQTGCEALFACGLEGTPPYCNYMASDEDTFVTGCLDTCAGMMSLLALIDPEDCEGTIDTLTTVSAQFADTCENGISQGGAGGGA